AEIVIDPTNIDWKVVNLPEGITMTIGGEDAYESNGVQNGYVIFTGGDDWSKEQIDEGQYRYTFRLGETVYHAQIHKYKDGKISEAPDGNRMRIQFGEKASEQYVITIYFWMDMPHMNGYLAAVNDVFVYHQDVLGYESDITCTVTEVGAHGAYDATIGDRSWDFRDYMYPFDSSGAINYLNYDEPGNSTQYAGVYVYSIESRTVLGAAKQCYVIKESVYTRSLVNERVELSEGIITEGLYGVDDGLLYLYTGPNSTTTLTSKPTEMGTVAQYPVTLNANGGRFSEEQPTCELGYAFTLEETTPRWTDNTFVKWNTRADGSGRDYVDGDRFNPADLVEGRIVLYAQWILDGFYVRVTGEGGTPYSVTIDKPYSSLNHGSVTYAPYDFGLITPPSGKAACAIGFLEGQYDTVTIANNNYSMHDNGDGTYNHSTDEGYRKVDGREVYYKSGGFEGYMWLNIIALDGEIVDLSLIWTTEVTAVTFHSNFGPDSTVVINYAVLGQYDGYFPAADLFERENYAFLGWATAADGNPQIPAGYTYDSSMGTEFWAIWSLAMTVTYNTSGGNGSIADQTLLLGDNYLSNGNGFSKAGNVIVGWATTENATRVDYPLGGKYTMSDSQGGTTLDLYAVWATGTYTVHFTRCDRGQGEFEGEMADQIIGVGIQTKLNAVTYEDITEFYEFAYWVLTEDGGGNRYTDKTYVTNLEGAGAGDTVTLKAWWEPVKYTVHFEINKPQGTEWDNEYYNQIIGVGVATPLVDCPFYGDEDYRFAGWNTEYDGSGTSYTNEQVVTDLTVGGDTFTLYAMWGHTKYTVRFQNDPRSAGVPEADRENFEGETYTQEIYMGVPTYLGQCEFRDTTYRYTFVGWNTMPDGDGTYYAPGAEVTDLCDGVYAFDLYAQWERTSYTLVFYSGEDPEEREWEDRGTMGNQNRQVGDGLSLPACTFTPLDGVVFDHWLVDYGEDVTEEFEALYEGDITHSHNTAPKVTAVWRLAE
ncbi:MAG: InlB B-repeat-containing protein, partial [Candidatus Methanomethylophilaceae archaeon]|nr:InlB B-repeat-containing protein [Candidatus Methanomethylophilaceae archaeon]